MPGLQLAAEQSLFPAPVPCCLSLSPLCVLCAVSLSATQYLGRCRRMGRNPSIWRQFRSFFCVSKPVLGDDCSVTYRALDLPGLPDLVGSVSRFRGLQFALQHVRFLWRSKRWNGGVRCNLGRVRS